MEPMQANLLVRNRPAKLLHGDETTGTLTMLLDIHWEEFNPLEQSPPVQVLVGPALDVTSVAAEGITLLPGEDRSHVSTCLVQADGLAQALRQLSTPNRIKLDWRRGWNAMPGP